MDKHLIVLVGPTGIGKTDLSIELAQTFESEIVSSDSRQVFREMRVGTAVPEPEQLAAVPHHLIQHRSIHDYYNVSIYEEEALDKLAQLFEKSNTAFLVGGSGMYIDVVCQGIDELPDADATLREELHERRRTQGLEQMRNELKLLDPEFYGQVDPNNWQRILKALEVCYQTGKPYSSFRTGQHKKRPFQIIKVGLMRDRDELYDRINQRVDIMVKDGLVDEARSVHPYKHYNSLNTVGYKEIFAHFDGEYELERAIELIKRNSRRFAKRQITWFKRDPNTQYFHPDDKESIVEYIRKQIQ